MIIHNTLTKFLDRYEPSTAYIQQYFQKNQRHFEEYFKYHCKNPDKKLDEAVSKHKEKIVDLKKMANSMPDFIMEIKTKYEKMYKVQFTKDVHLLVGLYGSNAYTYRQIMPEIAFCLEKLSPQTDHLKVIIAHEFGHALHNLLSEKAGIDWSAIQWLRPYTWLLQEGTAIYFSMKAAATTEDIYFAFEEDIEWLDFAKSNDVHIIKRFMEDLYSSSPDDIFREWFSINGGSTFGYTRLGYFIGYQIIDNLAEEFGEREAVTLWGNKQFKEIMLNKLRELSA